MTALWNNPETGATLTVFVHGLDERYGEAIAIVNKGETKTCATWAARVADTNIVVA